MGSTKSSQLAKISLWGSRESPNLPHSGSKAPGYGDFRKASPARAPSLSLAHILHAYIICHITQPPCRPPCWLPCQLPNRPLGLQSS